MKGLPLNRLGTKRGTVRVEGRGTFKGPRRSSGVGRGVLKVLGVAGRGREGWGGAQCARGGSCDPPQQASHLFACSPFEVGAK